MNNRVRSRQGLVTLSLLLASLFIVSSAHGQAATALQIVSINFPERIPTGGVAVTGTVVYRDPADRLSRAEFDVLDGGTARTEPPPSLDPFSLDLSHRPPAFKEMDPDGTRAFTFQLACDPNPRHIILKVTLFDHSGQASRPALLPVFCDSPPAGDFEQEEATPRPTNHTIVLNFYFLDDGVSTITQGTRYPGPDAVLAPFDPQIERALKAQIIPAISGIWDQCGLAFQLGVTRVVRPEKLIVPGTGGRNLPDLFFSQYHSVDAAFVSPLNGASNFDLLSVLGDVGAAFDSQLAAAGASPGHSLDVFIIGRKGLLSTMDPLAFGGVAEISGTVNVIHWQSLFLAQTNPAKILLPEIVVQAMAHEIGHNLSLQHVTAATDPLNLMISDPSLPRPYPPYVQLLPVQCRQAESTIEALGRATSANAQFRQERAQVRRGASVFVGNPAFGRGRLAIEGDARLDALFIGRDGRIGQKDTDRDAVAPLASAGQVAGHQRIDFDFVHAGLKLWAVTGIGQLIDAWHRLAHRRIGPIDAAVPIFRVEVVIRRTRLKHLNE
jgi:hypothetical protein